MPRTFELKALRQFPETCFRSCRLVFRKRCPAVLLVVGIALLAGLILLSRGSKGPSPPGPAAIRALVEEPSAVPSFVEVSALFGPRGISSTWGVSWSDIDFDGDVDLFTAVHMHYPSTLWVNDDGQCLARSASPLARESYRESTASMSSPSILTVRPNRWRIPRHGRSLGAN
jgi:hypothetical protein